MLLVISYWLLVIGYLLLVKSATKSAAELPSL
jgi:hypothetical protein